MLLSFAVYDVYLPAEVRAILQFFQWCISLGLDGIPITCVGARGFHLELLFWMVVPLLAFLVVAAVVYARLILDHFSPRRKKAGRASPFAEVTHFERLIPLALRIAFLSCTLLATLISVHPFVQISPRARVSLPWQTQSSRAQPSKRFLAMSSTKVRGAGSWQT